MFTHEENSILLREATAKSLDGNVRTWELDGIHIPLDIPDDVISAKTIVLKPDNDDFCLAVKLIYATSKTFTDEVAEFSTLEDLQKYYPNLFNLHGKLSAFFMP